ncbi:MAG: M23 family metallopeptidase [Bacteroidetes bacterium]|nr:M23 family metallopeptidase [Bacteroidota bacterium]
MDQKKEEKEKWIDRMQHTYRLTIMNNETFEEVGSYRLTLLNVYIALSTIIVVVAAAVILLMAFTPLRQYIPGYGDINTHEEILLLNRELEVMETELNKHRNYTEKFRKLLVGEVDTTQPVINEEIIENDSDFYISRINEDEQLRREVELEDIGNVAKRGRTMNFTAKDQALEYLYFTPPLTGEISAGFMQDTKHYGVDILSPKNTAIKAAQDGYVFLSDWTLETGNTIGIQHTNNTVTFYKHNSALLKEAGSFVKAGEAIAIIGNTGTLSDGPHLHFELWHRGKPVDPTEYINF